MPTKAELQDEIDALHKSVSSLKGQITKLKAVEPVDTGLVAATQTLVDQIQHRGLNTQVGQKQVRLVLEALG
jgi:hypothetical protein